MDELNVLVCDDDILIVKALEIYLKQENYGVVKAYNGKQALEALSNYKIHLILLDIMMPELDGLSATIKIREERNNCSTPLDCFRNFVEASKASSDNLTVNSEKVDLHELVLQACGEYDQKLKAAELDLRISTTDEKTFVLVDGKHMWRIVENLFSNVIKYSMPHSRVYINICFSDQYGLLTIKNISAFPLEISPQQLTERFVRGDVSRTTEGSGLGLSIAQSLTNKQGGRFKIEHDGDLFKVLVETPLWTEEIV